MEAADKFVRKVGERMRCPLERRATVLEELRAHLEDRAEALASHMTRDKAERQAVREMGSTWLLALRLSMTNGWHIAPYLARQVWAASLALAVMIGGISPISGVSSMGWQVFKVTSAGAAAFMFTFGFGLSQLARGWHWAIVPVLLLTPAWVIGGDREPLDTATCLAAISLCAGAMAGDHPRAVRLSWMAWGSAGGAFVWSAAWNLWRMSKPESVLPDFLAGGWLSRLLAGHTYSAEVMTEYMAILGVIALGSWTIARALEWHERRKRSGAATA